MILSQFDSSDVYDEVKGKKTERAHYYTHELREQLKAALKVLRKN